MVKTPVGKFHSRKCATEYAMTPTPNKEARVKKLEKKEDFLRLKVFRGSDLKTRKKAAKAACHAYIKARDLGSLCICCNRPLGKNYDSGHYLESNNNPIIRYHEDNIHSQSVYCNRYKGGDSDDYRGNLIRKIGLPRVLELEANKGGTMKRTVEDYKAIEDWYKQKLIDLKR